ncbi:hypothetical protein D3C85_1224550 [compost metagenome]
MIDSFDACFFLVAPRSINIKAINADDSLDQGLIDVYLLDFIQSDAEVFSAQYSLLDHKFLFFFIKKKSESEVAEVGIDTDKEYEKKKTGNQVPMVHSLTAYKKEDDWEDQHPDAALKVIGKHDRHTCGRLSFRFRKIGLHLNQFCPAAGSVLL